MQRTCRTGWGQEEDRRRAQEVGFDHHLVKPVGATQLHRLLAERTKLARRLLESSGSAENAVAILKAVEG